MNRIEARSISGGREPVWSAKSHSDAGDTDAKYGNRHRNRSASRSAGWETLEDFEALAAAYSSQARSCVGRLPGSRPQVARSSSSTYPAKPSPSSRCRRAPSACRCRQVDWPKEASAPKRSTAQAACRSQSTARNHPSSWLQLAKMRLTTFCSARPNWIPRRAYTFAFG
jgi:hypothetical protein